MRFAMSHIFIIASSVFALAGCEKLDCREVLKRFHDSAPAGAAHVNLPLMGGVAGIFGVSKTGDENDALPSDVILIGPKETLDETELQEGFKQTGEGVCIAPNAQKTELPFRLFHKDQP